MTPDIKQPKTVYKLITVAVLAAMVIFICRISYAGLIGIPYAKSTSDVSNLVLTNTFVNELSPYTGESLERLSADVNYDQPFLNSILAYEINQIFGCAVANAHFLISVICILATGYIAYVTLYKNPGTFMISIVAALFLMFCHWRGSFIFSAPDDLGLFLFILTGYVATCDKIRNKAPVLAVLITCCFYTKA